MVPENWEHPKKQPMFDESFNVAAVDWLADFDRIRAGNMTEFETECYPHGVVEWANDERPPDPKYYMPDWPENERTHLQMYETTSEGTPISPVMKTPEELAKWLYDNGASAFGGQTASYEGWLRVCNGGFAPSAVFTTATGVVSGVDGVGND